MARSRESWIPNPGESTTAHPSAEELEKTARKLRESRRKNKDAAAARLDSKRSRRERNEVDSTTPDIDALKPEDLMVEHKHEEVLVRPVIDPTEAVSVEPDEDFLEDVLEVTKGKKYTIHDLFSIVSFGKKGSKEILRNGSESIPEDIRTIISGLSIEEAEREFALMAVHNDPRIDEYKDKLGRLVRAILASESGTRQDDSDEDFQKIQLLHQKINVQPLVEKMEIKGAKPPPLPKSSFRMSEEQQRHLQRKYAVIELLNSEHFYTSLDTLLTERTLADDPQALLDYINALSPEEEKAFDGTRVSLKELKGFLEHAVGKKTLGGKSEAVSQFYKDLRSPDQEQAPGEIRPPLAPAESTRLERTPPQPTKNSPRLDETKIYNTQITPLGVRKNGPNEETTPTWKTENDYGTKFSSSIEILIGKGFLKGKEYLLVDNDSQLKKVWKENTDLGLLPKICLRRALSSRIQSLDIINTQHSTQRGFLQKFGQFITREKSREEQLQQVYEKLLNALS